MQPAMSLLEARNVRRTDDEGSLLLNDISVAFSAGSRSAITGPPGAGKTLLLRSLGLLDPLAGGEVHFDGTPIADADVPAVRRQVMLVAQRPVLIEGTVRGNLRLPFQFEANGELAFDESRITQWLGCLGRDSRFLDRDGSELSGGESQLVALLRALQLDPVVLLLDEPTASLDQSTAAHVEQMIADWQADGPQRTLIFVSHDPEQVRRLVRRVVVIEKGTLIEDRENTFEPA